MGAQMTQLEIPAITTNQMREVDRWMIEEYGIDLIQMMENAGRNLAALSRDRFLGGRPAGKRVLILAGSCGNGGGGMVAARRLNNWGADVFVITTKSDALMSGVPAHQPRILRKMGVSVTEADDVETLPLVDLILDAVIGYNLQSAARTASADLIELANASATPILSLDVPSGMDATTGKIYEPAVRATTTMTLALPKTGLMRNNAQPWVGELYLADISVPPGLYERLGLMVRPIFMEEEIIRLK
jgi:NAD(P)H-hydrate epimerase